MRSINCRKVTDTVSALFQSACVTLPDDVISAIRQAKAKEKSPLGQHVLKTILENINIAQHDQLPLCQDTGVAVLFMELGQEVHITGGNLTDAINEGVRLGYRDGYLRKSMVLQPFSSRYNTLDNTPAVIHIELVPGDKLRIRAMPKGGGAENCSRLVVLPPSHGRSGIINQVVDVVSDCGCNACPPLIIGVGIGGTAEKTMLLAKKSLLRKIGQPNADRELSKLEKEILREINQLGIGPMGFGGTVTALAVHVEAFAAHIASLPLAVNIQCWCSRHNEAII